MNDIDKTFGRIPFVIKELEPDEQEKMVYYAGHDFMEDRIETINGVDYKFYGKRSIDRSNARKAFNVGTVGHIDFGRDNGGIGWGGYQPLLDELCSNMPSVRFINRPRGFDTNYLIELWSQYMHHVEGGNSDADAIRSVFGSRRKLSASYLDFDNGGLVVAGRVIWILPDEQYAKFHKHAADWTMPTKEYIARQLELFAVHQRLEALNPVVATVQGVQIRKNDVANGWTSYNPSFGIQK